jgi:hypothetical protein
LPDPTSDSTKFAQFALFDACSSDMADQHSVSSASDVRMAHLLAGLATGQGFSASRLPGVKFMRSTAYAPPTPITYEPSIVVVAQGRKAGRLGARLSERPRSRCSACPSP